MSATDRIAEYLQQRAAGNNTRPVIAAPRLYPSLSDQPLTVEDLQQVIDTNRILSQQAAEHEASLAADIREAKAQAWDEAIAYGWEEGTLNGPLYDDNPYRD